MAERRATTVVKSESFSAELDKRFKQRELDGTIKRYEDAMKMDPTWQAKNPAMFLDAGNKDLLVKKLDAVIDYKKTIDPKYVSSHVIDAFRPRIGRPEMKKPGPVELGAFQFLCKLKGINKQVNKVVDLKAISVPNANHGDNPRLLDADEIRNLK